MTETNTPNLENALHIESFLSLVKIVIFYKYWKQNLVRSQRLRRKTNERMYFCQYLYHVFKLRRFRKRQTYL